MSHQKNYVIWWIVISKNSLPIESLKPFTSNISMYILYTVHASNEPNKIFWRDCIPEVMTITCYLILVYPDSWLLPEAWISHASVMLQSKLIVIDSGTA